MAEPEIVELPEQPYVGIVNRVTMAGLPRLAAQIGEVFGWLAGRDIPPAGPPIWRYSVIDMAAELEVVVAVPVAKPIAGDGRVLAGSLPAGSYLIGRHRGEMDALEASTGALLDWAAEHGVELDVSTAEDGDHWVSRFERYLSDPVAEPDPESWRTDICIKVA